MNRCLTITPARDEAKLLPGMITSMVNQTVLPSRWVVIDDGSTDATSSILDAAARAHSWIEVIHLPSGRPRAEGGESVVMKYLTPERLREADFVLRLDADLTFRADFIENLIDEFGRDPALGIGGATLYEPSRFGWREVAMPSFHTRGAVKMYSVECFQAIGGLEPGLGWDTLDEVRAMMKGFKTRSFRHIRARHHRPQGAAGGMWRGRFAAGRAAYQIGYSPLFLIARAAKNVLHRPILLGSLMIVAGYLESYLQMRPRAAAPEVVKFVRQQQIRRLFMMDSVWR